MASLRALGDSQLGLWTHRQALEVVTPDALDRLRQDGTWRQLFPGTLCDGGYQPDAEQWALAAVLASGGVGQPVPFGEPHEDGSRRSRLRAIACGRDAARVWGFPLIDDDDPATGAQDRFAHDVHVWGRSLRPLRGPQPPTVPDPECPSSRTTPHPDQPRAHELTRHRFTLLPDEVVRRDSGLWLTTPLCTAIQCVGLLGHEAAVCVLDDGLHRNLFTTAEMQAVVDSRRGTPGGRAIAAAVAVADGRAESPAETLARLLLTPRLPGLVPQVELLSPGGHPIACFDLGDERVRLAVDVDGRRGHAGERMLAKDQRRDLRTSAHGWVTERAVWFDVRRRQQELIDRVVARDAALRRAG